MSVYNKNNKFISYLIILFSFFIIVLITKDKIVEIQENIDLRDTYQSQLDEKKTRLADINEKKAMLNSSPENIDKYILEVKEDEIIDYLYSYIEDSNRRNGVSIIKSISISDPSDTEIGFKQTTINLNLMVPSEDKLKSILDFLTSPKSEYNFFIESFKYPYGNTQGAFSVNVPLKLLYK